MVAKGGTVFERRKKRWSDLTRNQRRGIVAAAAVQLVLGRGSVGSAASPGR
jgi:hypothetical protein